MNEPRRHFSGPETVAIVNRHLFEKVPVSDLCDELEHPSESSTTCTITWIRPATSPWPA